MRVGRRTSAELPALRRVCTAPARRSPARLARAYFSRERGEVGVGQLPHAVVELGFLDRRVRIELLPLQLSARRRARGLVSTARLAPEERRRNERRGRDDESRRQ